VLEESGLEALRPAPLRIPGIPGIPEPWDPPH